VWSLPECSRPTAAPCTKRQRQIYTRTTRCRLTDAVHPLTHYTVLTALVFPSQSWLPSRSWGVWAASQHPHLNLTARTAGTWLHASSCTQFLPSCTCVIAWTCQKAWAEDSSTACLNQQHLG
jgi:hypothetical protein